MKNRPEQLQKESAVQIILGYAIPGLDLDFHCPSGVTMKTMRVRKMIKEYIAVKPRSTKEILDHINSKSKHGTNLQILGNILGKDKDIVKVGTTKVNEEDNISRNGHYKICVWALRPGVILDSNSNNKSKL